MSGLGALCILLAIGLAALALTVARAARRRRGRLGLPAGRIVSADMGGWRACERPLYSDRYRLAGKPDYVVQVGRDLIPVEVKPGRTAASPYEADVLQLAAYLLLVEEDSGRRPPYGLLCYGERHFEIPNTPALRRAVTGSLQEMRRLRGARRVSRQHQAPQRCLGCGYRAACDQALT